MAVKNIEMAWVTVADMQKAKDFFAKNLGLNVVQDSPEFGWAELAAENGIRLGLGVESPESPIKAGQNAIVCLTVDNIATVIETLKTNNATLLGNIVEVPGHVKMQLIQDADGNLFHVIENIG